MQLFLFALLILTELIYLFLAGRYNITDKPSERSSHQHVTIRGGGIIFVFAAIIWFVSFGFEAPLMIMGLTLIAIISFLDDLISLSYKTRIIIHFVATFLLLLQADLFYTNLPLFSVIMIVTVGWINVFNFMDGINGITPFYSLTILLTLYWFNLKIDFAPQELINLLLYAVLIFSFFNARRFARIFSGDVGSISLAFLLAWLVINLILKTGKPEFLLLFSVYGIDSCLTIIHRIIKKENIFKAHRTHLYQHLANELKMPHVTVAFFYALTQGLVNIGLIFTFTYYQAFTMEYAIIVFGILSLSYLAFRNYLYTKLFITGPDKLQTGTIPEA